MPDQNSFKDGNISVAQNELNSTFVAKKVLKPPTEFEDDSSTSNSLSLTKNISPSENIALPATSKPEITTAPDSDVTSDKNIKLDPGINTSSKSRTPSEIDTPPVPPLRAPPRRKKKKKVPLPVDQPDNASFNNSDNLVQPKESVDTVAAAKNSLPTSDGSAVSSKNTSLETSVTQNQVQPENERPQPAKVANQTSSVSGSDEKKTDLSETVDQVQEDKSQKLVSSESISTTKKLTTSTITSLNSIFPAENAETSLLDAFINTIPVRKQKKHKRTEVKLDTPYKISLVEQDSAAAYLSFIEAANKAFENEPSLHIPVSYLNIDDFENDPTQRWKRKRPSTIVRVTYVGSLSIISWYAAMQFLTPNQCY